MTTFESELSRGWRLHQQKHLAEAERIYRTVLAKSPKDANAWCYLGIALNDQRRYAQAVQAYETALSLNPRFPIALNNLGNSLRYLSEFDRADQCFQQAIDLKPDYFNAFKNRGTLHAWTRNLELALKYYGQALQLSPNDAELHRNLGVIYLLQGRFHEGWREYRWRWKVGDLHRLPNLPVWDGCDLKGKSIVLTAEQGLGDTLHFARFASVLRQHGARTMIYGPPSLLALLQSSSDLGWAYPNNLPLPQPFQFQCSLLDVADFLNVDLDSIPGMSRYIRPAGHLCDYWKPNFPRKSHGVRVGIAWQGNPEHQADIYRSMPLSHFEPISRLEGVELVCLQQGFGLDQVNRWQGFPLTQLDPSVDASGGSFMDTAAIISMLDLVISSDTSIAHLAAAIGTPTWIPLSFVPDWRWLLGRSDSPWYPSVKLFRQSEPGQWSTVFRQIGEELQGLVSVKTG